MQKNEVDPIGFGLRYQATHLADKNRVKEWNVFIQILNLMYQLRLT